MFRSNVPSGHLQIARFELNRWELFSVNKTSCPVHLPWGHLEGICGEEDQESLLRLHLYVNLMSTHPFSVRMLWGPPGHAGLFCPCIHYHSWYLIVWKMTGTSPPTMVGSSQVHGSPLNPHCEIPRSPCPTMKIFIRHYSSSFPVAVETNLNETLVFWKRIWF